MRCGTDRLFMHRAAAAPPFAAPAARRRRRAGVLSRCRARARASFWDAPTTHLKYCALIGALASKPRWLHCSTGHRRVTLSLPRIPGFARRRNCRHSPARIRRARRAVVLVSARAEASCRPAQQLSRRSRVVVFKHQACVVQPGRLLSGRVQVDRRSTHAEHQSSKVGRGPGHLDADAGIVRLRCSG